MTRAEAKAYRKKVVQGEQVEQLGGITEKIEQSDKSGMIGTTTMLAISS